MAVGLLLYAAHRYRKKRPHKPDLNSVFPGPDDEETKEGGGKDFYFVHSNTRDPSPTSLVLPPVNPF